MMHYFPESPVATTVLSLFGYLMIDCTWTSVYLMTSELFPTVLRWVSCPLSPFSSSSVSLVLLLLLLLPLLVFLLHFLFLLFVLSQLLLGSTSSYSPAPSSSPTSPSPPQFFYVFLYSSPLILLWNFRDG